jgi:hypothetical protein
MFDVKRTRRSWLPALVGPILFSCALHTFGFSLLGPFESWMVATNGFFPGEETEIGGPMCISNGYRWNLPVVTYGFDPTFLDFFGSNGVSAVQSAINLLNSVPPSSLIELTNYATEVIAYNYEAQFQGLLDLKSATLTLLLEHLGLAPPSEGVFCLHNSWFDGSQIEGDVLRRNYDPVSNLQSSYINYALLTYELYPYVLGGKTYVEVNVFPAYPEDLYPNAVADGYGGDYDYDGAFYIGLSRDDVGGLSYLYSTNNVRYETLLPDVGGVGGNSYVNGANRPGVDKVTFVQQPYDPVAGDFLPLTNQFLDSFVTNGVVASQQLQRVTKTPDFLFCATNLAVGNLYSRSTTANWINNAALNSQPSGAGPGMIAPPVRISFNRIGQSWENDGSEDSAISVTGRWGTFDGSTNAPVTYSVLQTGNSQAALQTPVCLELWINGANVPHFWYLNASPGAPFNFQTTTNFGDWTTLFQFTNDGSITYYYDGIPVSARRFFRIAPE